MCFRSLKQKFQPRTIAVKLPQEIQLAGDKEVRPTNFDDDFLDQQTRDEFLETKIMSAKFQRARATKVGDDPKSCEQMLPTVAREADEPCEQSTKSEEEIRCCAAAADGCSAKCAVQSSTVAPSGTGGLRLQEERRP